jgi:ribosomal protein L11 methyltransferase
MNTNLEDPFRRSSVDKSRLGERIGTLSSTRVDPIVALPEIPASLLLRSIASRPTETGLHMASSRRAAIDVPPRWRIVPDPDADADDRIQLVIDPGPGFGNGAHETTQVCLQAIAALAPRAGAWRMLDFGSGSGILAIGAAKLGAVVDAVEIDGLAAAHGERNAHVNAVADRIRHARTLEDTRGSFDFVVANILRSILVEFAGALVARLGPGATLVLSGLVSTDVPQVGARYASLLQDQRPEVYERGEWRALVWRRVSTNSGA